MTDNSKLARWQGYNVSVNPDNPKDAVMESQLYGSKIYLTLPNYLNDDAAAMSLLDTLVEKGYMVLVVGLSDDWTCQISIGAKYTRAQEASTRREAVVAAVLELIGKEGKDDV